MGLDITAQDIIIDETTDLQKDDIDPSVPPHDNNTTLQYLLTLGTSLEVAFQADFVQATADAGETITSVVLTQNSSGTPFSTTDGVLTDIQTVDGNYVWLFQDPNNADVVIGVIGTDDPTAEPDPATAPLAFSFGLDHTSTTDADLYLVQYVALLHPLTSDPDDRIDLHDQVFASIAGTSQISFSGQNAAPGNHDFYLINSPDDASKQLLVIGLNGGTANVSTQGFGINNQSINPNETLQVDFVTGGNLNAGTASQIQYASHIETITQAGFTINQITPSKPAKRVDVTIKAYDNTANQQGTDFFDGTTTNPVDIVSVKLTGASGFASTITADGTYATPSGNVTVTGLTGTGNAVTITGLDNITTVDITTATKMDRMTVTGVDANEGCDITEFHFNATTTNAHTEEVGQFINFDDDGPTAALTDESATVLHDETAGVDPVSDDQPLASLPGAFSGLGSAIGWAASASAVVTPNSSSGTDGPGTETLSLDVSAANADSGFDSLDGHNILLNVEGDLVVGRVDDDDNNSVDNTDPVAIAISIDQNGILSVAQYIAIAHPTGDPDEVLTMNDGALLAVVTATDGDDDSDSDSIAIGDKVQIRDDGPSIERSIVPVPGLVVDESDLNANDSDFSVLFTAAFGNDGPAATDSLTFALDVLGGGSNVATGLFDTLSGLQVLLNVDGDDIVGSAGGDEVFRISVDADGNVTLDQSRALVHGDPTDPDENDTPLTMAANLVTLTAIATDGDGDSAPITVDIGAAFKFEDDGPTITAPFDGDPAAGIQRETLHNVVSPPALAANGVFGYSIGNDIPDYNGADNIAGNSDDKSDFVDGNLNVAGVQLALSGFVGSATPPITGSNGTAIFANVNNVPAAPAYATLVSEDANFATFNFTFHYDKDPITTGIQDATAGGQLIFDKVNDTYSIALNDVIDGFAFDVVHTSQDFARNPNTNSGHPEVVVAQLTPNGDPNPFLVQFTANNSPFSFSQNGEGATADTAFTGANHDMATSAVTTWVSATQGENGVAGDTIQKGELLTIRFFKEPAVLNDPNPGVDVDPVTPGIQHERTEPTTTASGIVLKFDGIGNAEDLVVILDLVDTKGTATTADDTETTVALNIQNSDFLKGGAVVPSPYTSEFSLSGYSGSNNDALIIIEQNDYTANANVLIQGVQIMQSANGLTGTGINFVNTTGANGGSLAGAQQALDTTDNDVLKIVDIGFVQSTSGTLNASLDFAVQLADADGDVTPTPAAHILVDVVA
ncbi:DUF5801 repeats-in-toxin domain-containing protein [Mesorhizobium sp. IMUNJ 23033]|uniref:DUF5801 repeats-in-toxin domain-containing protein n=1 Tax=Mesorhizobium sp. IMUNJ 23033 TaxID=3378039 RepID=UPI00384EE3E1